MKYTIISGSHQEGSQSFKVAEWLAEHLDGEVSIIKLAGNPFPLWSGFDTPVELEEPLKKLKETDGIIIVSPEWHGMAPAGLKNFLLHVSDEEVGHKPVLLVGISAGRGGAYPISELRSSGYKNNKMNIIPDHLIVREVNGVMNDQDIESGSEGDLYIKKRALFSLAVLQEYTKAFISIRKSGVVFDKEYRNGM